MVQQLFKQAVLYLARLKTIACLLLQIMKVWLLKALNTTSAACKQTLISQLNLPLPYLKKYVHLVPTQLEVKTSPMPFHPHRHSTTAPSTVLNLSISNLWDFSQTQTYSELSL